MLAPGPVARSDARPPGIQTVAGSILGSGKIFVRGHGHKIISTAILSFPLMQLYWTVVSYWRKDVHLVLVNRLGSRGTVWIC